MATDIRSSLKKEIHELPASWTWEWFTDIIDIEGGTQPPASTFIDSPRKDYVRLVQIRDFETDAHLTYIPDSKKWRKCETHDVLIARYGAALGRICRGLSGAYNVALAKIVPNERLDLDFAYQLLRSDYFQKPLLAGGARSAQAGFNKGNLAVIPVPIPPLLEQRRIAQVLGALDAKIDLNRRMNETLEAIAQAFFQSWFVDFDPVRRNAGEGGCRPQDFLFPDSFQESSLGKIPRGWKAGPIMEEADLLSGGTPKTDVTEYWNGSIPWASAKDISQCGEALLVSTERNITDLGLQKSSTKIIPELATVIVSRGATTGRLTMLGDAMAMNQTCYGLHSKFGAPFALYCHSRHFIDRLVQGAHGSVFETITTSTFAATDVLLAPSPTLLAFDRQVAPLFRQILVNLHQSRVLGNLRNTLLPKFLSGELRVPPFPIPADT